LPSRSSVGSVVLAATAASTMSPSSPSPSLSSLSLLSSLRPPSSHRSHALCPLLLLLFLLFVSPPSITASPYYERDWTGGDDDATAFETDGTTSGSSARPPDSPSISIPHPSAQTRIETTTDRPIRAQTISTVPTVPSPQIVTILQQTSPLPTILSIDQYTSLPDPEPANRLEQQNTRMMEIVANLTKKLTQNAAGTGSDISISFTPDELKKMQEIIGATDERLKANLETTRRRLMIPNGPEKIPDVYNYDVTKELRPEKEIIISTDAAPERNSTVIDEATLSPTESIPDDLVLSESDLPDQEQEVSDGELVETLHPALCKLKTDDEVVSVIWMFLQSRIREWGYDEDQSTILVLATFGFLLDSENTLIEAEEPSFLDELTAAVSCIFRDCQVAMPNRRMPEKVISMPSSPKLKRETIDYHSDLFECRCPKGYVFV
ncbi:hypothetical protein PENTCL1PPCAC_6171, partial [Pristionchus entomophagus]